MDNKSGRTDKKAKKNTLQDTSKNITRIKGNDNSQENKTDNNINNCKG